MQPVAVALIVITSIVCLIAILPAVRYIDHPTNSHVKTPPTELNIESTDSANAQAHEVYWGSMDASDNTMVSGDFKAMARPNSLKSDVRIKRFYQRLGLSPPNSNPVKLPSDDIVYHPGEPGDKVLHWGEGKDEEEDSDRMDY